MKIVDGINDGINRLLRFLIAHSHYLIAVTHRYMGNAYGDPREYEAAIDSFTRAIDWHPNFAQAYLDRGILYWREFDHPRRAIHDLTTAFTLDPSLSEAQFNRGVAHQQLREYDEAMADFKAYLAVGEHPYWREHAESMIRELREWVTHPESAC